MAIHWYKSALIITTIIHGTACLSADNDSPMTGPYGGKRKFTAIEDGSPLPSANRS